MKFWKKKQNNMVMENTSAIGIDLGTTCACVGVWKHGKVEIIPNDHGNRTTPCYVAFTDVERLIGDAAKNQLTKNPNNTVFDMKRLIGRRYEDRKIHEDMIHWPFKVVNDCCKLSIQIEFKGKMKKFVPEEISSMVLSKMKETAETFLGTSVRDAVITVPAHFNDSQRQATKDAGTIAGLNVLRIINEPTAAALAYSLNNNLKSEKNVLIFDLGGGTFDVSILAVSEGSFFQVKATAGDTHLGGVDFDNRLLYHLVNDFEKKFNKNISNNPKALRRLRLAAEQAKRILSSCNEVNIEVDTLCDRIDFYTRVSRAKFEELCEDLFKRTLQLVDNAITDARLNKSLIHHVVLVGGSTRIPKIQIMLQEFFNRKLLNLSINPDEAVAYGAAVQAAILSRDKSFAIQDVLLIDVAPLSLDIWIGGGKIKSLIQPNTIIPCQCSLQFTTHNDNQTSVLIKIYEGKRILLGTFCLSGISPAPRRIPKIVVTFDLDCHGILNVTAIEKCSGSSNSILIKHYRGRLSKFNKERMLNEAEKLKVEDGVQRARIAAINQLESYVFGMRQSMDIVEDKLTKKDKSVVSSKCNEVLKWCEENLSASKEEYEQKEKTLQSELHDIMIKLYIAEETESCNSKKYRMSTKTERRSAVNSSLATLKRQFNKLKSKLKIK